MPKQPRRTEDERIGSILRELRESRGLRARQLAPQLEISESHLRAIEIGDRRLTNLMAHRAARALDVPVATFRPASPTPRREPAAEDEDEQPELAAAS